MILDNITAMRRLDKNNVAGSIANLPKQLASAWAEGKKIKLPPAFGRSANIIFCGMGGSNLASQLIKRVFGSQIKVPMILVRNYNLPAFANKNSLIIIDSYSGNTEEALSCLNQALKLKSKIICLSSNGKLELLAKKFKLASFKLNPSLNPSGQPRYDVGSQLGATLAIFNKLKLISVSDKQIAGACLRLTELNRNLELQSPFKKNQAKKLAKALINKAVYIIGAEFLTANAHILANQINESAKQLASPYKIPELNHHFLEALAFPRQIMREIAFVFLVSADYSERILKRFAVTKKILDQKSIINFTIKASDKGTLNQALEILTVGGWVSFYLAMSNKVNPSEVPWVDYFKQELEK